MTEHPHDTRPGALATPKNPGSSTGLVNAQRLLVPPGPKSHVDTSDDQKSWSQIGKQIGFNEDNLPPKGWSHRVPDIHE